MRCHPEALEFKYETLLVNIARIGKPQFCFFYEPANPIRECITRLVLVVVIFLVLRCFSSAFIKNLLPEALLAGNGCVNHVGSLSISDRGSVFSEASAGKIRSLNHSRRPGCFSSSS